jgi:CRISPR-associated protein Cmr4
MGNSALTGKTIWLKTLTSLHAGCGSAMGAIDLPVQREKHTAWPLIPASSLKGVFRDAERQRSDKDSQREARLYGSEDPTALTAGALCFTDARLLLFPVRSLVGTFAYVTCPLAISRWVRDTRMIAGAATAPELKVKEGEILVAAGSILKDQQHVILEEFRLTAREQDFGWASFLSAEDRKRLAVVTDDQFTWFCEYATETVARIGLEKGTKTVKEGALFYQELVPAEALFYLLVSALPTQRKEFTVSAEQNLQDFWHPEYLQVGGDETTGRGLCHVQ